MNYFILSDQYLDELVKYDINRLWLPSLGHYAVKRTGGNYSTPVSEIVALNRFDLIFTNIQKMRDEYFWIPTIQDLIELYWKWGDTGQSTSFSDYYFNNSIEIIKEALELSRPTLEQSLISLLHQRGVIELLPDTIKTFSIREIQQDLESSEHKEKFLKEYI